MEAERYRHTLIDLRHPIRVDAGSHVSWSREARPRGCVTGGLDKGPERRGRVGGKRGRSEEDVYHYSPSRAVITLVWGDYDSQELPAEEIHVVGHADWVTR